MNFKDPKVIVGMLVAAYLIYHFFIKDEPWPPVVEGYTLVKTDDDKNGVCGNEEKDARESGWGSLPVTSAKLVAKECKEHDWCKGFTYKTYVKEFSDGDKGLVGEHFFYDKEIKKPTKEVPKSACYTKN